MSSWIRKGITSLFLVAAAAGGEEFFRHMVHEDNVQQQVLASKPYTAERTNLIDERETERGIAGLSGLGGFAALIAAGLVCKGKSGPKAAPG
jgi:hypothetical protein